MAASCSNSQRRSDHVRLVFTLDCILLTTRHSQERFDVDIKPLPEHIDASTYMNAA